MERRRAGEGDNEELSQEARINRGINLDKKAFKYTEGLFHVVHSGKLMDIVKKFNTRAKVTKDNPNGKKYSKEDIQQLLFEPDDHERTPLDIAAQLGHTNTALYLITKMGPPQMVIHQEVNLDKFNRNAYHSMCYNGNYDCLTVFLNIERVYMKYCLFTDLLNLKNKHGFKNLDI
jgi:hypothetical protein